MKIPSKLAAALFVLVPCLAGDSPTGDVNIVVVVTTVKQESPLQIVGLKLPDKVGGAPVVVLRNASNKQILGFHAAAAIGNPEVDNAEQPIATPSTSSSSNLDWPEGPIPPIPANSEREARGKILRSHLLAAWGGRLHSSCLHVAAFILSVEFADGTTWQLENLQDRQIWKSSLGSDSTKTCGHSFAVESALQEWDGASGYVQTGSPIHLDASTVQSYSVTCQLRSLEGKLVAICPW